MEELADQNYCKRILAFNSHTTTKQVHFLPESENNIIIFAFGIREVISFHDSNLITPILRFHILMISRFSSIIALFKLHVFQVLSFSLYIYCYDHKNITAYIIGFPGQIRRFISQIYFLCIQIRRFWHYGVNLLF